jgi:hypothetical protein
MKKGLFSALFYPLLLRRASSNGDVLTILPPPSPPSAAPLPPYQKHYSSGQASALYDQSACCQSAAHQTPSRYLERYRSSLQRRTPADNCLLPERHLVSNPAFLNKT